MGGETGLFCQAQQRTTAGLSGGQAGCTGKSGSGAQSKAGWPAVNNHHVTSGRQATTLRSEGSNLRSWHRASTPAAGRGVVKAWVESRRSLVACVQHKVWDVSSLAASPGCRVPGQEAAGLASETGLKQAVSCRCAGQCCAGLRQAQAAAHMAGQQCKHLCASSNQHVAALLQQPSRVPSGPMPSSSASLYLAYRASALSALGICSRDTAAVQHTSGGAHLLLYWLPMFRCQLPHCTADTPQCMVVSKQSLSIVCQEDLHQRPRRFAG